MSNRLHFPGVIKKFKVSKRAPRHSLIRPMIQYFQPLRSRVATPAATTCSLAICLALATACGASAPSGGTLRGSAGNKNESVHGGGRSGIGGSGGSTESNSGIDMMSGGRPAGNAGQGGSTAANGGSGSLGAQAGGDDKGAAIPNTLVPANGVLLGQYYEADTIEATNAKLGRTLPVHLAYWDWETDWTSGDTKDDIAAGRIPLVNWEPAGIEFSSIADGTQDAIIKARAAAAKALKVPFFLDFAAEMNGDEAWSGNDAKLYIKAYRHVHDLFVAAGATNVVWAWCPNVVDVDGSNAATLSYYPGDDYVDWTGVDGYNWGGDEWQSFKEVFQNIYPILAAKKKPILIGEMASSEMGGDKAAWINAIIPTLKNDFPLIKGLIWFDVQKERDWLISSSPASEAAFRNLAADPFFSR